VGYGEIARRVLADRKAAVQKAEDEWTCACRADCERDRAARIAAVEEKATSAHFYCPACGGVMSGLEGGNCGRRAISAIIAAAKGER
jgi:hypothetical protein